MANADNAFGFKPVSPNPRAITVRAGGTFSTGDALMWSSGKVVIHDAGANLVAGVAATDGESGETAIMWSDPNCEFIAQCSGTYAEDTHDGTAVDLEGATGAQEVNENASTQDHMIVLGHHPIAGSEETGANAVVRVKFLEHASGAVPATS